MKPLRLLTGWFAAALDWAANGRRVIPRHPRDGRSTLTYGEVRRAAVAFHGPGTKVRIWHDGSGHLLPPPPYREEEWLYSFDSEFQLRRLLPALGTITLEEWRPDWFCSTPECSATDNNYLPRHPGGSDPPI